MKIVLLRGRRTWRRYFLFLFISFLLFFLMNNFKFAGAFTWIGRFFSKCIYVFGIFRFSERTSQPCYVIAKLNTLIFYVPYLFWWRMFFSITFLLFPMSSVWFRFFRSFFLGTMSLLFWTTLWTVFRLMVVNGFLTFIVRWMGCLWTSCWVTSILSGRWRGWYCVGFVVCFSSTISIVVITDVRNSIS